MTPIQLALCVCVRATQAAGRAVRAASASARVWNPNLRYRRGRRYRALHEKTNVFSVYTSSAFSPQIRTNSIQYGQNFRAQPQLFEREPMHRAPITFFCCTAFYTVPQSLLHVNLSNEPIITAYPTHSTINVPSFPHVEPNHQIKNQP